MILIVDEEAQGSKEEFCSVDKLKREVVRTNQQVQPAPHKLQ